MKRGRKPRHVLSDSDARVVRYLQRRLTKIRGFLNESPIPAREWQCWHDRVCEVEFLIDMVSRGEHEREERLDEAEALMRAADRRK